jgi:hypothetical protein
MDQLLLRHLKATRSRSGKQRLDGIPAQTMIAKAFEEANGHPFLDEIGDVDSSVQSRLPKAIEKQNKSVTITIGHAACKSLRQLPGTLLR